jgi:hypothetical protein
VCSSNEPLILQPWSSNQVATGSSPGAGTIE